MKSEMLPRVIELRPSRWMLIWIISIHLAASLVLIWTDIPLLAKSAILALVTGSFFHQYQRLFGNQLSAPELIHIQTPQQWRIVAKSGESMVASLQHKLVFRYLVVVYLVSEDDKKLTLLLPEDSMPIDLHRKLRAGLRLSSGK